MAETGSKVVPGRPRTGPESRSFGIKVAQTLPRGEWPERRPHVRVPGSHTLLCPRGAQRASTGQRPRLLFQTRLWGQLDFRFRGQEIAVGGSGLLCVKVLNQKAVCWAPGHHIAGDLYLKRKSAAVSCLAPRQEQDWEQHVQHSRGPRSTPGGE